MAARLAAIALMLWGAASGAVAECRQALMLALDVSGSVDQREYRLQLDGLANALLDPQVVAALEAMPGAPVRLAVMEWSGPDFQRIVQPWVDLPDVAAVMALAARLRATARVEADLSTAIGAALLRAGAEVQAQSDCWRRVIDVSGDGKSNTGPLPGSVGAVLDGVTVNGLVIGEAVPTAGEGRSEGIAALTAYYRAYVLRGEDAFLETAAGFEAFEAAMVRKLLRELQVVAVSDIDTRRLQER
ncbi:DUF1194 domain-containing protein [Pseudooceanicola onchidii]|uniref:DUF1194 domain-containing protein n=1 Tax=Pseudooceanicola onchidii TaxID=2562279 RepID=UPI0010AADDCD|nr:DUF1194 domain-containing protein [Pseudooceanicola onchidii]